MTEYTIDPRTREDFFLAKIAGEDIDITTLTPSIPINMWEKIMLAIADRIDGMGNDIESGTAITPAAAVADLTDAPTKEDFNGLLAKLRAAGFIAAE